jgi:hypothetical protein
MITHIIYPFEEFLLDIDLGFKLLFSDSIVNVTQEYQ